MAVELYPGRDHAAGVWQALEAMPADALLLQRPDHPFDQSILLWAMQRDEVLAKAVATHQMRVSATGEDQSIVRTQLEGLRRWSQTTEPGDQRLLQC